MERVGTEKGEKDTSEMGPRRLLKGVALVSLLLQWRIVVFADEIAVDQSTPRGTLKVLNDAIQRGDADGLRQCLYAETDLQKMMAEVEASSTAVLSRLTRAARERFGKEEVDRWNHGPDVPIPARIPVPDVESLVEEIDGDDASVRSRGAKSAFHFKKLNGAWKIRIDDMPKMPSRQVVEASLNEARITGAVLDQVASEIKAGKFRTAADAAAALRRRTAEAIRTAPPVDAVSEIRRGIAVLALMQRCISSMTISDEQRQALADSFSAIQKKYELLLGDARGEKLDSVTARQARYDLTARTIDRMRRVLTTEQIEQFQLLMSQEAKKPIQASGQEKLRAARNMDAVMRRCMDKVGMTGEQRRAVNAHLDKLLKDYESLLAEAVEGKLDRSETQRRMRELGETGVTTIRRILSPEQFEQFRRFWKKEENKPVGEP